MVTRKKNIIAMVLATLFIFGWIGCESIPEEHRGAATGAGVGAATGAAAGEIFGDSPVVGGLLGALVGGAIGHYAYDERRDREETIANYDYEPASGTQLNIENVSVTPQQVSPGETVELGVTYALLTPVTDQSVAIREIREVEHNNQVVANPEVKVQHTGGTYTSTIPIKLPSTAEPGQYTVTYNIEGAAADATRTASFTVR